MYSIAESNNCDYIHLSLNVTFKQKEIIIFWNE